MMQRIRTFITYANVMASIALLLSLGGTAYAAAKISGKNVRKSTLTGKHVKNASLTSAKIKNGSLTAADLSSRTRQGFRGPKGSTGLAGMRGLTGQTGPKGDTGPPGAPAEVVTSFASRDTGFVVRNNYAVPNAQGRNWFDYNCAGSNTTTGPCAGNDGNQTGAGVGLLELIPDGLTVIALQGMSKDADETNHRISSSNAIQVPWSNNLTGMASVTIMHRGTIHERVECGLEYANASSGSTFAPLGERQMVSAYGDGELVTMTIIGSKNVAAGTYNVQVVCSDMDDSTLNASWRFVRGNLTAMAARNG